MRAHPWIVQLALVPHDRAEREALLDALSHLAPSVTDGDPPALEVHVSAPSGDDAILYVSAVLTRSRGPFPEISSVLDLRPEAQSSHGSRS
jgi:hypothetical protein